MSPPISFTAQEKADALGLPWNTVANPVLVTYRSVGIGIFGACMRLVGMPLEKMALFMNSSQVTPGKGQIAQAVRLTFQDSALAPYRVVGPSSLTAWFLQYSVMGVAFQFFDHSISKALGVEPVAYGKQLMEESPVAKNNNNNNDTTDGNTASYQARWIVARVASPVLAATLESLVSNRAEVQRFFGPAQYAQLRLSPLARIAGPAFIPNVTRNFIMCQTSFLLTPLTYKLYFPQEHKSMSSLFWYGLGVNIFVVRTTHTLTRYPCLDKMCVMTFFVWFLIASVCIIFIYFYRAMWLPLPNKLCGDGPWTISVPMV
jgi:hypothetical protein